ncbi:MAG TPA: DUF3883 domain-containing protein [Desulfobacteraceae bacterium]|nr:DUF3883 domain-containing protein [Desulfobacteraceae bacterium]HPJ66734.1 DUF3883 domain-containing protein [Desulfobacteraceae bacterium]
MNSIHGFKHRIRRYETCTYRGIVIESRDEIREAKEFFKEYLDKSLQLKFGKYTKTVRIAYSPKHNLGRITINDANLFGPTGIFKTDDIINFSILTTSNPPILLLETEAELEEETFSRLPNKKQVNPERFEELQKRRKELGILAEKFVFECEKEYLTKKGKSNLIEKMKHISQYDIGAGYDILSFNEYGDPKFIEVKSRAVNLFEFEWTINEYEIARKKKDEYWIYFVINTNNNLQIIKKIRDPIKQIENGEITIEPSSYLVNIN